jgi:hypothetical protein
LVPSSVLVPAMVKSLSIVVLVPVVRCMARKLAWPAGPVKPLVA